MPKYIIERTIPNAGNLSSDELSAISQNSCGVLQEMGAKIQWNHSYVMQDKVFCEYIASNEEMVRTHADKGGFPVDAIYEVKKRIDPTTAEV